MEEEEKVAEEKYYGEVNMEMFEEEEPDRVWALMMRSHWCWTKRKPWA